MKIISLFLITFFGFFFIVFAGGTETNPLSGAKTFALNGLYFAGGDGIIKSLNNPAGLIYLENTGLEITVLDRLGQNEHINEARGLHRSFRSDDIIFNGGILWSFSDDLKASASYQQAINYNVEWPFANYFENDSLNSLLVFDMFNRISADAILISFAYKFDNISVGISPAAYFVKHKVAFPQSNTQWQNGIGLAAYQVEYDQQGWGFGINAGVIAEFNNSFSIGLSVRSAYSAELSGSAKSRMMAELDSTSANIDVSSKIEFPWILGLGAIYSVNPNLNLNIDFQYSLWGSTQKNLMQSFSSNSWQDRLSQVDNFSGIQANNFVLAFNNSLDAGIGLEFLSSSGLRYWLGYRYTQSPNSSETYNMLFPAVDQHWLSIGAGLRDEFISLEGTLAYAFGVEKNIVNNLNSLSGSYNYNAIIPMVTLKYWFY